MYSILSPQGEGVLHNADDIFFSHRMKYSGEATFELQLDRQLNAIA